MVFSFGYSTLDFNLRYLSSTKMITVASSELQLMPLHMQMVVSVGFSSSLSVFACFKNSDTPLSMTQEPRGK